MSSAPRSPSGPLGSSFTDHQADELIDIDQVLRSFAHERRREILGLLDGEPVWMRGELAERLHTLRDHSGASSREETEIALVHSPLPTLEQADLIAIEEDPSLVKQGERYNIVRNMTDEAVSVTTGK